MGLFCFVLFVCLLLGCFFKVVFLGDCVCFEFLVCFLTDPDGYVGQWGGKCWVRSNPELVFKDPMGRCRAPTPSSLSLTI